MIESKKHAEILDNIIESLKNWTDNCEVYSSHGRIIGEFLLTNGGSEDFIELAQPDLVINKDERLLFVEVELSSSPKKIIGDVGAIDFANYYRWNKDWHKLPDKKSLLIILEAKSLDIRGSGKRNQMNRLKEIVRRNFNLTSFDIVTDDRAMQSIEGWLATGQLS